uniref:Centrosomal protein 135 n=1 Tax=Sphenodon punctatus TaxID=8508 RepID=A0A8D0HJ81_SPHPU
MSTAAERKFINLRKRLDQLGYRHPLGVESLPLVEKIFSDLVHTTESLRSTKLSSGKIEKECSNVDVVLEPYKAENGRLTRENNELHLDILNLKEQSDRQVKDLKATLRKIEHDTADMKFLNNQYIHKIRSLERDNKAKTERIQQLQEKNLQAVVQTPGGRKRNIPFRRQRMQIDQPAPPSGIICYPIPQPDEPYVADLLEVADNRIHELQLELSGLQEKLEIAEHGVKNYKQQVDLRDREIERLGLIFDAGRSHDVISLEARNKSNEKIIAQLNLQVEYLQQTNRELEIRIQYLLNSKQNVTSEVVHLSNKNEELCQELSEIDHLAQRMERRREIVLETADKEIGEAKVSKYCNLLYINNMIQFPPKSFPTPLKEHKIYPPYFKFLKMLEGGIVLGDKSPSRLDAFVKSLEDDRDHYKREVDYLQKLVKRRFSPLRKNPETVIFIFSKGYRKSNYEDLRLVTRERDELQSMLDRFEKHMIEIQSKVKLLTSEKDKLSILYEQSQDELNSLRKEAKCTLVSQSHAEEERNVALSDFRRMMSEKESLRDKLKVQEEAAALEKSKMEQNILELGNTIHALEAETCDLMTTISELKDRIASLEDELKAKSQQVSQSSDESSQFKTELSSLQLLNEQLQKSLDDIQCRFSLKEDELQSAHEEILILEEKIERLHHTKSSHDETMNVLRGTINVLDKEKDSLQDTVDEKTEKIAYLDDNLANKEKMIAHLKQTISQLESSLDQVKDAMSSRHREQASLRRQLDAVQAEIGETGRVKEMALKENRRLQDDLTTMTRENQAITAELEETIHDKEEMKTRVHNYITEVSRFESLMTAKEQENRELLEKFRLLHSQAEGWEVKAHQAEGESSSVRLELLSVDTERRHLRERVELLEKEIQEHISAHQVYESQISSVAKNMSRLEETLKHEKEEKNSVLADLASVRELCVKLETSKELLSRQLTSKKIDYERILTELEDVKSEAELLKKQLASERLTIQNLEVLLATSRDKEFQNHLTSHEKDSEIQLLKDKLTLAESKLTSHNREVSVLRSKVAQLQTDYDILKRQLTTERFERERAIQEMRRHGLTTSLRTSSPLSSTLRSPSHSPERALIRMEGTTTEK